MFSHLCSLTTVNQRQHSASGKKRFVKAVKEYAMYSYSLLSHTHFHCSASASGASVCNRSVLNACRFLGGIHMRKLCKLCFETLFLILETVPLLPVLLFFLAISKIHLNKDVSPQL